MWLLLFLFISCTPEPSQMDIEDTTPMIETEVIEDVEITLQDVYKRSIGSQYEVYDIGEVLTVYIQTGDSMEKIFQDDYTINDVNIIIDGRKYPYELYADRIIICGYSYLRH